MGPNGGEGSGGGYFMAQEKHASEVVIKFGMAEAKVVSIPFEPWSAFGMVEEHEQEGVDLG